MIKAIILDLGYVINRYRPGSYYRYLARVSGKSEKTIFLLLEEYGEKAERGKTSVGSISRKAASLLGISRKRADYMRFYSKNAGPNRSMIRYARELKKKYVLACLSNIESGSYNYMKKRYISSLFNYSFLSYKIGLRKPDKRIYLYALKKLGVKPEETVFVDDVLKNVAAARSLGMNAILFKNTSDLKMRLPAYLENS